MAMQDDKQDPSSKWEAQTFLGKTECSLGRVWEN